MKKLVVGLGEVLWDMLPQGKYLGGAPANFAYITSLLGDQGVVASRLGTDALGDEASQRLQALGLPIDTVQRDPMHPTGVVKVEVDREGLARFEIEGPSAWDFLEWTADCQRLAERADAVCFGSLAQRSQTSRETIRRFLSATRSETIRVFDVNLRQAFYSKEVVEESMKLASIMKMNDEEVPKVMRLLKLDHLDEESSTQKLIDYYGLKLVCVTRGSKGSLLVTPKESHVQPGISVKVADTIGAGDAFTAALVHQYMLGASLASMNRAANLVGAWVSSQAGPTPVPQDGNIEHSLAAIG
jgi:fructokinase